MLQSNAPPRRPSRAHRRTPKPGLARCHYWNWIAAKTLPLLSKSWRGQSTKNGVGRGASFDTSLQDDRLLLVPRLFEREEEWRAQKNVWFLASSRNLVVFALYWCYFRDVRLTWKRGRRGGKHFSSSRSSACLRSVPGYYHQVVLLDLIYHRCEPQQPNREFYEES